MRIRKISSLFGIIAFAVVFVFMFIGCEETKENPLKVINIADIKGVTVPINGGIPVTVIAENEQYSGTVEWKDTWNNKPYTFTASTVYTATIILMPKAGYTLQGVATNFFTVAGATSVRNNPNSGVITAIFSASTNVINIAAIQGVIVPANGLTPVTVITENEQYSGIVTWNDNPSTFAASTVYTATITLTPKKGYSLQGVMANFFTVIGATSVSNAADSGVITALFPATDSRLVNNIVIKTQPTKLTYTHGDPLDLTGLVVTLIYNNGATDDVNAVYFPIKSITTNPAQGDKLDYSTHNGQPVKIMYGSLECNTNKLSLTIPTFTSIVDLKIYLQSRPANTADSAYIVALNVSDLTGIKDTFNAEYVLNKYVNLDISGSTITTIPICAFWECTNLTSVTIPNSVTSIGYGTFYNCTSLTSVTIPDNITSIEELAFSRCTSLTNITIPNNVTSISGDALRLCTSLITINVDSGNENYSSENGILYNKNKTNLIAYPAGKTEISFIIPDSVTSIGYGAFYKCTSLTSVTIPNSVTSIENEAFAFCISLTSVTIGNGITNIGNEAFQNCTSLTSVTIGNGVTSIGKSAFNGTSLTTINVNSDNLSYSSDQGVLYNKSKTILVLYPKRKTGAFTIPDSVTSIGDNAFSGCTGLTSVTIPDSVTSIGDNAFAFCTSLTSVTIPNSVTSIGNYAFEEFIYYNLKSVTFERANTFFYNNTFPNGFSLKTAYSTGGIGTYTMPDGGGAWMKVSN